jgi:hypothetical protein
MRVKSIGLALIGALAAVGCSKDDGPFFAPQVPLAYTRFINAVPDTGSMDFRFIDQLEYSPFAIQTAFKGFTPYQGTAPGSRHLRVFYNPGGAPELDVVTIIMLDEQLTFEANKYYSIVAVGFSRAGQTPSLVLKVYEDPIPDPGSNVAYRVVNLATGLGAVNVSLTSSSGAAIPGSPDFSSVAYLDQSAYVTKATGAQWFRVQQTTSATEIVSGNGRQAPAGVAGDPLNQLSTIGGSGQAGSVVTAYVYPRSVAGSPAPQGSANANPAVLFIVDKHPGR